MDSFSSVGSPSSATGVTLESSVRDLSSFMTASDQSTADEGVALIVASAHYGENICHYVSSSMGCLK